MKKTKLSKTILESEQLCDKLDGVSYATTRAVNRKYTAWAKNPTKKNLKKVEDLLPKKVSWRFAPRVPSWMKWLLGR